ncbi:hypothetical protein [Chachezhania antarctica]|uniref:hypothetical protein n=1 Tax=Chachezhania antarctica TaxID=2340860 RepID=UPI0013CEFA61|nr:hypothetical protein [Chachezhania antarctica]|tara:strand:+ start:9303 stop:9455 length:153 start_codon:yes stop_codon:yes gene_type:complete
MVRLAFFAVLFSAGFYVGLKHERGRVEQNCSDAGGVLNAAGYCEKGVQNG